MDAASETLFDWEFEERLAQIPLTGAARDGNGPWTAPGMISLTLLAVGAGLGLLFFILGFVLLFFCIGVLVWYCGAAIVALLTGIGAVAGIVAIAVNARRPAAQVTGILGFVLNSAACAACVTFLVTFHRLWR